MVDIYGGLGEDKLTLQIFLSSTEIWYVHFCKKKKNLGKTRNSSFGGLSNSISTFGTGVTKVTSWAN